MLIVLEILFNVSFFGNKQLDWLAFNFLILKQCLKDFYMLKWFLLNRWKGNEIIFRFFEMSEKGKWTFWNTVELWIPFSKQL